MTAHLRLSLKTNPDRILREVERNERKFSNKSNRELAEIAKDESRPYLERVGAAEAYKKRK